MQGQYSLQHQPNADGHAVDVPEPPVWPGTVRSCSTEVCQPVPPVQAAALAAADFLRPEGSEHFLARAASQRPRLLGPQAVWCYSVQPAVLLLKLPAWLPQPLDGRSAPLLQPAARLQLLLQLPADAWPWLLHALCALLLPVAVPAHHQGTGVHQDSAVVAGVNWKGASETLDMPVSFILFKA